MIIPLITLAKLIALGSIKFIFLLLGIAFFPKFALRLIIDGATGMLVPMLAWLAENDRLDKDRHDTVVQELSELSQIELSRQQARQMLLKLLKKMINNLRLSIRDGVSWCKRMVNRLSR